MGTLSTLALSVEAMMMLMMIAMTRMMLEKDRGAMANLACG